MLRIVGLVTNRDRQQAVPELHRMVQSVRRAPIDVLAMWAEESLGLYLGWVASRDPHSGGMPLRNESGDVVLLVSGEEFPEPGTEQRLKQHGHAIGELR